MHHYAHIGFVDSHSECGGCHHHSRLVGFPEVLPGVFLFWRKSGMVESGAYPGAAKGFRHDFCAFARAHIDNGATRHAVEDMDELLLFEVAVAHHI